MESLFNHANILEIFQHVNSEIERETDSNSTEIICKHRHTFKQSVLQMKSRKSQTANSKRQKMRNDPEGETISPQFSG